MSDRPEVLSLVFFGYTVRSKAKKLSTKDRAASPLERATCREGEFRNSKY